MPTIQIRLSDDVDKELKYFMLDNEISDKKAAIIILLKTGLEIKE